MNILTSSFLRVLSSLTVLISVSVAQDFDASFSNTSYPVSPFTGVASVSSRGLGFSHSDRSLLVEKRQTRQCSIPGGRKLYIS